jgi:FkbH-like protein
LQDKFGDYGIIGVVILRKENDQILFIDSWFMSCRVLKRGMEYFILNTLVEFTKEKGFSYLKGEYLPTVKNEMVKDHYLNLDFTSEDNYWMLSINDYNNRETFISRKSNIKWKEKKCLNK